MRPPIKPVKTIHNIESERIFGGRGAAPEAGSSGRTPQTEKAKEAGNQGFRKSVDAQVRFEAVRFLPETLHELPARRVHVLL